MKSIPIFLLILFLTIVLTTLTITTAQLDTTKINTIETTQKLTGALDPETGLPTKLNPLLETGEKVTKGEITTNYLKQEWTKILDKSQYGKYFLGFLNFTGKVFSFFDPLWKFTFGTEFQWTWSFFLSFLIWVALIIILYSPSKAFIDFKPIYILLFAIVIASLAGSGGIISRATDILSTILTNFWLVVISVIIAMIILAIYYKFFGDFAKETKKETEEEKLKRAQENIKAHGKISEDFLKNT